MPRESGASSTHQESCGYWIARWSLFPRKRQRAMTAEKSIIQAKIISLSDQRPTALCRLCEIALGEHHVDALVAVDHLRDAHIRGEARQRVGLIAVEPGARANEIEHLPQRDEI